MQHSDARPLPDALGAARKLTAATTIDPMRPVRFRRVFHASPGGSARLTVTGYGLYRAFVNGAPVGDEVLTPGWQPYQQRHHVQHYDVSDLIVDGDNAIGIEVAEGWYRGRLGFGGGVRENYGTETGVIACVELDGADGPSTIVTDENWCTAPSAVTSACLYDGETYDQRLDDGWTEPGFDAAAWSAVSVREAAFAALTFQDRPAVRRIEEIAPRAVTTSPSGAVLVDFGQNLVGRLRVQVPAVEGLTISFRHAEVLEHGELGVGPLRDARATDTIHTSGAGGSWEPAFTFHGFRYVEVAGWPGSIQPGDLTAVVIHTDLPESGTFRCSHELLNRLHENARWSAKGNFVSIPTDCPQRDERLGWTGDLQVFAPTALFMFNSAGFLRSWLRDLAVEQAENEGIVPMFVPALPKLVPAMPFAGWGDAAVVVPWVVYERTGDPAVLAEQYDSMRHWVEAIAARSDDDGLWRPLFQLGDWLDPSSPPENAAAGRTDGILVGAAYQVRMVRILADAATVIGRLDDAAMYSARADALAAAFRAEYVTPNGRLMSDSPTAYALALRFGLLAPEQITAARRRLLDLVTADRFRVGTGFLGTPVILDALADCSPDHAFRLLLQTECPSWLYAVTMGATTIWERWDSMLPDGSINPGGMTSFNHYAFGAVADFLHRRVAGLAPGAPGYATLEVRPLIGGGLTEASASHLTPHGPASVSWRRVDGEFTLAVEVPDGTSAIVGLPDGSADREVGSGRHEFRCTVRAAAEDGARWADERTFDPAAWIHSTDL